MSSSTKVYIAVLLVAVGASVFMIATEPKLREPVASPKCVNEDEMVAVTSDYQGSRTGWNQKIVWKSGTETLVDQSDDNYVGKKVCREYR